MPDRQLGLIERKSVRNWVYCTKKLCGFTQVTPVAGSATGVTRKAAGIATSSHKHFKRRLSAIVYYKVLHSPLRSFTVSSTTKGLMYHLLTRIHKMRFSLQMHVVAL